MALMFGISTSALERDVRSQTVFELIPGLDLSPGDVDPRRSDVSGVVRFGLRFRVSSAPAPFDVESTEPFGGSDVSVMHSYYLARHIATRLSDKSTLGIESCEVLRYLGQVKIDDLTSAILREMFQAGRVSGFSLSSLAGEVRNLMRELSRTGGFAVFNAIYRHLMVNCATLGCIDSLAAVQLDPWTPSIQRITISPRNYPDYQFVLIPAGGSNASPLPERPFLLGLHEITNRGFELFMASDLGREWAVELIRGSTNQNSESVSTKAPLTSEYHLYFWEPRRSSSGQPGFGPPVGIADHPVVYVSWHAAMAFCKWLGTEDEDPIEAEGGRPPFRLPKVTEWNWAAHGHFRDAGFPWEVVPYAIPGPELPIQEGLAGASLQDAAAWWFWRYRNSSESILLNSGNETKPVLYDEEFSPFAVAGLIGNVKEWVEDVVLNTPSDQPGLKALSRKLESRSRISRCAKPLRSRAYAVGKSTS
jgi:formylglycine-generating enzyme required for sulfatase activity